MEDVYTTEGKITATTQFSTTKTTSSELSTLSITGRINEPGQHLYILQTTHTHSDPPTGGRTYFPWHVTFKQTHQKKPLTLLRGHPPLAHQNSHNQRHKGYQEKSQPTYQNLDLSTGNISTCHLIY